MHITSNAEILKLREAALAEKENLRSPEAVGAAVDEFVQRTGYRESAYGNARILSFLGDNAPTAENLEVAATKALASEVPLDQLRQYLLDQESLARGK